MAANSMNQDEGNAVEILELSRQLRPLLAAHCDRVQSGALADLVAIWLCGYRVKNIAPAGAQSQLLALRSELFAKFSDLVMRLAVINDQILAQGNHEN